MPFDKPVVIAHRGASGYLPEHTIAAYELAIEMGADYIEPDLVSTKDGVLVARHENFINETTDVADRLDFADRRRVKVIDGVELDGWFTEDFTLAELKTLRAKERIPGLRPDNVGYGGQFEIATFDEILALAKKYSVDGRTIGIYPETKHPSYFASIGLPLERKLVDQLSAAGYTGADAPVCIQSFEVANLKALRQVTDLPLIQLIEDDKDKPAPQDFVLARDPRTYVDMLTPKGLAEIATYADGIGPSKRQIIPWDEDGTLGTPTSLVDDAHRVGLLVHPYTFRLENDFLPADFRIGSNPSGHGDLARELDTYLAAGIDGMFSDFADLAVAAKARARSANTPLHTASAALGPAPRRSTSSPDPSAAAADRKAAAKPDSRRSPGGRQL